MSKNNRTLRHIYALTDPENGHVRYVGMTKFSPETRLYSHFLHLKLTNKKDAWLKSLLSKGLKPNVVLLEKVWLKFNTPHYEYRWVKFFKKRGHDVLNCLPNRWSRPGRQHKVPDYVRIYHRERYKADRAWVAVPKDSDIEIL